MSTIAGSIGNSIYNPLVDLSEEILDSHGGISKGTTAQQLDGKSMNQMFDDILFPKHDPIVYVNKSLTVVGQIHGNKLEIGTIMNQTLTSTFNRGTIKNGNGTININPLVGKWTEWTLFFNGLSKLIYNPPTPSQTTNVNFLDESTIVEGINEWTTRIEHLEGEGEYYDSKGNISTVLDNKRVAAEFSSAPYSISGRYKLFFGSVPPPVDSDDVRKMDSEFLESNRSTSGINYFIPAGEKQLAFAVPAGSRIKVTYVESNLDVTGTFLTSGGFGNDYPLQVWDGGTQYRNYHVYTTSITGYSQDATYRIEIIK